MICISINQESRRFALVDMHNAAAQCDLLEIRLDRFGMAPEIADLVQHKRVPVIMTCRRKQDGGHWDGSEAERLALLRQCVISKCDYVEIELDAADQIKRHGSTKRVIAIKVKRGEAPATILSQYADAQKKDPDVIKLTTEVKTPEQAWPFVQILAKSTVPTVVTGEGKAGMMLTILGKKVGAPWTYAALEKGMEAYPAQPSVRELRDVYHYEKIARKSRLVGVTGFGERDYYTVAGLNAAFAHLDVSARCLPLAVGNAKLFEKIIDACKLASVVVDTTHQKMLMDIVDTKHPSAEHAQLVDLLLQSEGKWTGYYSFAQASLTALSQILKAKNEQKHPLRNRVVILVGLTPIVPSLAAELLHRKASVILASRHKKNAQDLAKKLGCRHIKNEAMYTTMHDTLIVCDDEKDAEAGHEGLHPSILKAGNAFVDLTTTWGDSALLDEARQRDCVVVPPREILLSHLELQAKLITGQQVERGVLAAAIPADEA